MEVIEDHRFAGLLEAAPDAMVCVDADGRIALVNAQTERLFGYGRDELVGQPVEMLVPDAVRDVHPGHRAGYVADPRLRPMGAGMELAGRRRDGSTFPAEISLSAIDTEEGILVSAAVRDVTDRRRAEARFAGLLDKEAEYPEHFLGGEVAVRDQSHEEGRDHGADGERAGRTSTTRTRTPGLAISSGSSQ